MDTLAGQVHGFAAAIAAGLTLGLFFDLYRLWRRAARPERAVTALSDLLFWLAATPVTYIYLLIGNWAELRFYVFLGLFLGLFLYFSVLSIIVLNVLLTIGYYTEVLLGGLLQGVRRLFTLPWEGAARWRASRRWQPGGALGVRMFSWRRANGRSLAPRGLRPKIAFFRK
ncbi:MAG: spore cortex biosynthesis protein YabQ [Firmicutes bacterium]|jgi:spore cortex biosynthesis protein YabQ|nr:spore cortex biosynthesis protein YabQ [Bacillota bacterium]